MTDVVTGLRQVIQDLVAPEMKAHAVKLEVRQRYIEALRRQSETVQKSLEVQHDAMMKTLDAFRAEMRSEFASLRANN